MKFYGIEFLKDQKSGSIGTSKKWATVPAHPSVFLKSNQFIQKKDIVVQTYGKRKPEVLILSGFSVQSGYLCEQLKKNKISFVSINLDEFIFSGRVSASSDRGIEIHKGKQTYQIKNFKRVYFEAPQFLLGLNAHPEVLTPDEKIVLSRWKMWLEELEHVIPQNSWWPAPPTRLYEGAQKKFADLEYAKKLGLKVPETILTMDPHKARQFVKKHKSNVLFREFATRRIQQEGLVLTFEVKKVNIKSKYWSSISTSPTVFQQYIDKSSEYRIVMVGRTAFCCRIVSDGDWRITPLDSVKFEKIKLHKSLLEKLYRLMQARGLKLATFDVIEEKNKTLYFLEMNRPGQWLFVEALLGYKISDALISKLKS